ncbi:MAG TPA: Arm DNA-binding domain-containing protein [Sphingobium sp.]|uniref:Arm DNA-binding domain-containing protein n=1 Tax=Sphingobium sp. TaxID=1912891 RepID=UPI002ED1CC23
MTRKPNPTPTNIEALRTGSLSDPPTPGVYIEVQTGRGRVTRIWKYRRRFPGKTSSHKATLGSYPTFSMANAREWATNINTGVERGINPTEVRQAEAAAHITVSDAHALYIAHVKSGVRRKLKPGTIVNTLADRLRMTQPSVFKHLKCRVR